MTYSDTLNTYALQFLRGFFIDCKLMTYTFSMEGEVPAKKNSRIVLKSGKNIPSKTYQAWHSKALAAFFYQKFTQKLRTPLEDPLKLNFIFTHGDLRCRDSDNGLSSLLDTFKDAGIIKDDNWQIIRKVCIENEYKEKEPGVRIEITKLQL